MQELFAAMKAETVPLGEKLIAQEADLERQFAGKTITEASLAAAMQAISSDASGTQNRSPQISSRDRSAGAGADPTLCRVAGLFERPAA